MLHDTQRAPLSREVPKILFVVSRLGSKVRKPLLSPSLVPVPCVTPFLLGWILGWSLEWPSWPEWKSFYEKQQVFLNLDLLPCLPTGEPLSYSGSVCQRDQEDSVPLDFILSPISTLAMGKDPMAAGNSFTCFLIIWLQELQSRKDNLYCETHNKRLEFITAGLLIYTRLCRIQTRLYSAAIHINAHQQVQERFYIVCSASSLFLCPKTLIYPEGSRFNRRSQLQRLISKGSWCYQLQQGHLKY